MLGNSIIAMRLNKAINKLIFQKDLTVEDKNLLKNIGVTEYIYILRKDVKEHWWNEVLQDAIPVQDEAIIRKIKDRYFCFYYNNKKAGVDATPTSIYEVYRHDNIGIEDFNCWYPRIRGVNDVG